MSDLPLPLAGLRVLDFTTLLPGPLATLALADAGATVVKVERPQGGDAARATVPREGEESINFALLNRGKKSLALDLKSPEDAATVKRLAGEADVLVEQFRPGVMERLGLGYQALSAANPGLIYCSITGYGQTGPLALTAGHNLNYEALTGMLSLSVDGEGKPVLPQAAAADIGGGTLPAVTNILLALLRRATTGRGCYLDVAMAENILSWTPRALGTVMLGLPAEPPRSAHLTGGSPRHAVYLAADGRALTVAAIEGKFWNCFCDLIGLEERDDEKDPIGVKGRVATILAQHDIAHWAALFQGQDVCVEPVQDVAGALTDPHFVARGVWSRQLRLNDGRMVPALPTFLAPEFTDRTPAGYPALGADDASADDLWPKR